jgi:hypothetical protein
MLAYLTGGAGYCLSRELIEKGRTHFIALEEIGLNDDMAVGYVVQEKAGGKLIEDMLFHSHLESDLKNNMTLKEISNQVSFGWDNKLKHDQACRSFPDVPMVFSLDEDPLHFQSLRYFLNTRPNFGDTKRSGADA